MEKCKMCGEWTFDTDLNECLNKSCGYLLQPKFDIPEEILREAGQIIADEIDKDIIESMTREDFLKVIKGK